MEVSTAELKVCLAAWQKNLDDAVKQRDLFREGRSDEAVQYNVSLGELRALDLHCLDLLNRVLPRDSKLIQEWHVYEPTGDTMMDGHIRFAAHKVGVLKLVIHLLEGKEAGKRSSNHDVPSSYTKIAESLALFRADTKRGCHDYDRNVFVMTRFSPGNKQLLEIYSVIKECLNEHGLHAHRADDRCYPQDRNLWDNVCTYMIGCKYGIAILEDVIADEFNPNVALEYGFMRALGKPTLLLKERRFRPRADILGTLWEEFDILEIEATIRESVARWISDIGADA